MCCWATLPIFIKTEYTTLTTINFLRDKELSAQVCDIEKGKYSEISYDAKEPLGLMNYSAYREFTGYNFKNENPDIETIIEIETTKIIYVINSFIFGADRYYGVNSFGTEIVEQ